MIYIKRRTKEIVEYHTKAQADRQGIAYVPWREAREAGQWVLSDDQYVVKTRKVVAIPEQHGRKLRTRYRIVTELATRFAHGSTPMNIKEHIETRSYGITPTYWYMEVDQKLPALRPALTREVLMGTLSLKGWRYNRDQYAIFQRLALKYADRSPSDPRKGLNWYHVRTYFNHEKVREMIRKDIAEKAAKRGYSVDKVFDLLDEVEDIARTKKDGKLLLALARDIASVVGMKELEKAPPGGELPQGEDMLDDILKRKQVKDAKVVIES